MPGHGNLVVRKRELWRLALLRIGARAHFFSRLRAMPSVSSSHCGPISSQPSPAPSRAHDPISQNPKRELQAARAYAIQLLSLCWISRCGVYVTMDQLKEVMRDVFDDDNIEPTEAMTAEDVEGWDSLSHIRLMVSIEKRFEVKFTNAEVEKFRNVGDLLKAINSKVEQSA
jgi:acyl carrier protein